MEQPKNINKMEVTVHLTDGTSTKIPASNLNNFKRVNGSLIDFIEEEQGAPVFSKPITSEPAGNVELATMKLTKNQLLEMAEKNSVPNVFEDDTKGELVEKINSHLKA